jgi:putative SOS response-associated peptidase YedK
MSGRYTLFQLDQLRERFQLEEALPSGLKKRYNIAPGQMAPVIIEHDRQPKLVMMKWGFVPKLAKDVNSIFRYKT